MIAIWLASTYGLMYVGFYLTVAACISLLRFDGTKRSMRFK
jgi:hypothetical protein